MNEDFSRLSSTFHLLVFERNVCYTFTKENAMNNNICNIQTPQYTYKIITPPTAEVRTLPQIRTIPLKVIILS